jgi:LuxR family quorum sensing-dependent transcriptional regulator
MAPAETCALLPSRPEEWRVRYFGCHYVRIDPVANQVKRSTDPFLWSEAPYRVNAAPAARVMGEATEFGLNEGFCVPVHHMNANGGAVSFGAVRLELSEAHKAALHLVSIYAYQRTDALVRAANTVPVRLTPKLSPRKIECLKWMVAGNTSWEASEIL